MKKEDECHEPQFNYIFFAFVKFIVENLSRKKYLGDFSEVKIYEENFCFVFEVNIKICKLQKFCF